MVAVLSKYTLSVLIYPDIEADPYYQGYQLKYYWLRCKRGRSLNIFGTVSFFVSGSGITTSALGRHDNQILQILNLELQMTLCHKWTAWMLSGSPDRV